MKFRYRKFRYKTPPVEEVQSEVVEPAIETQADAAQVEEDSIALVEALIFAAGAPVSIEDLARVTGFNENELGAVISTLQNRYIESRFGFELIAVAGKYQFRTKGPFASFVRELKADKPRRLSAAALETLAIIAYRQPVVRSDVEKIRGVDVSPTLKTLLERNLIRIVGHQSTVGQPALYGTTDEFLKIFGLNSLGELPTLRDLTEFEKEPGEERSESEERPEVEEAETQELQPEEIAPVEEQPVTQ